MRPTLASTSRLLTQQTCPAVLASIRRGLHTACDGKIQADNVIKDGKRKNGTMSLLDLQRSVWGVEPVLTPRSSSLLGVDSRVKTSSIKNEIASKDQLSASRKLSRSTSHR